MKRIAASLRSFAFALAALLPAPVQAQWEGAMVEAFYAVASGSATDAQRALAFRENHSLNMMAEQGFLPRHVYSRVQGVFNVQAQAIAAEAARAAGLDSRTQLPDPNKPADFKPGTDVDIHALRGRPGQEITMEDMVRAREAFDARVNEYLRAQGLEPLDNPSRALSLDIMPAEAISPEEFARTAEYINRMGGTMYRDPVAARVEAGMRGSGGRMSLLDLARYVSEQQRQVMGHDHTRHLTLEISRLVCDPDATPADLQRAANLTGQVQLEAEQTGKYQERINRAATAAGRQYGVEAELRQNWGRAASELVASERGPTMANIAGDVDALRGNTTLSNTQNFVDTVTRIARARPELRAEADAAIAEATRNLTPAQRGQILETIRSNPNLGGEVAASSIAEEMRANSRADAPDRLNSVHASGPGGVRGALQSGIGRVQRLDARIGSAVFGVGELADDASALRRGANRVAGGAVGALGGAWTAYELGAGVGEYTEAIDRLGAADGGYNPLSEDYYDTSVSDEEANQAFEQAEGASMTVGAIGTVGAVAEALPVVAGGTMVAVGSYAGTRYLLEGTAADEMVFEGMDAGMQGAEGASAGFRSILGMESEDDWQQREREASWRAAIARGEVTLKEGTTVDDVIAHLRNSQPSDYLDKLAGMVDCKAKDADKAPATEVAASPVQCPSSPGFAGDGEGTWFCCEFTHPAFKTPTCSPAKNRCWCNSQPDGKPVEGKGCGTYTGRCDQ